MAVAASRRPTAGSDGLEFVRHARGQAWHVSTWHRAQHRNLGEASHCGEHALRRRRERLHLGSRQRNREPASGVIVADDLDGGVDTISPRGERPARRESRERGAVGNRQPVHLLRLGGLIGEVELEHGTRWGDETNQVARTAKRADLDRPSRDKRERTRGGRLREDAIGRADDERSTGGHPETTSEGRGKHELLLHDVVRRQRLGLLDQIREGVGMARGSISWQHSGQTPMARSSAC